MLLEPRWYLACTERAHHLNIETTRDARTDDLGSRPACSANQCDARTVRYQTVALDRRGEEEGEVRLLLLAENHPEAIL